MKAFSLSVSHLASGGTVTHVSRGCLKELGLEKRWRVLQLTVWKEELDNDTENNSDQTLTEEEPLPARETTRAGNGIKSKGKDTTENTRQIPQYIYKTVRIINVAYQTLLITYRSTRDESTFRPVDTSKSSAE